MIEIVSDNIVSPLGTTSAENYRNVKAGKRGIKGYDSLYGLDFRVSCSMMDNNLIDSEFNAVSDGDQHHTRLEKMVLVSAAKAIKDAGIDASKPDVKFYLSTTKGNIALLDQGIADHHKLYLHDTARTIASYFGNTNRPIVISNACISGISAIITACRELEAGRIEYAVISGVDEVSKFAISGFSCLKAISSSPCRPFDINRNGLNLGEAAVTIVLRKSNGGGNNVKIVKVASFNDAYHISSPSRTAEGAFRSLSKVIEGVDKENIAFVNAHGTATFFNDEMESVAITRAGLEATPVNALKGYYGHTLGAAGILETIISKYSILDNTILKTLGYNELGTSHRLMLTTENISTHKQYFVKLVSGFGGTNAAALLKKEV
ncbi:MAG: beta-ketoacyl synthase [Bacteroidales bacterium]|nr:beta-ketoacyl synthase [Bacteroidales bacterium]